MEFDSITKDVKNSIPFDQPFTLKITYKDKSKPVDLSIYELDKYGKIKPLTRREFLQTSLNNYDKPKKREFLLTGRTDENLTAYKVAVSRRKNFVKELKAYYKNNRNYTQPLYSIKEFPSVVYGKETTTIIAKIPPLNPASIYKFDLTKTDDNGFNDIFQLTLKEVLEKSNEAELDFNVFLNKYPSNNFKPITYESFKNEINSYRVRYKTNNDIAGLYRTIVLTASDQIPTFEKSLENTTTSFHINDLQKSRLSTDDKNTWWIINKGSLLDAANKSLINNNRYNLYLYDYTIMRSSNTKHTERIENYGLYNFKNGFLVNDKNETFKETKLSVVKEPFIYSVVRFHEIEADLAKDILASIKFDSSLEKLYNFTINWSCSASEYYCKNKNSFIKILSNSKGKNTKWDEVLSGKRLISFSPFDDLLQDNNLLGRQKNLLTSIKTTDSLINYIDYIKSIKGIDPEIRINELIDNYKTIQNKLITSSGKLNEMIEQKSNYITSVSEIVNVNTTEYSKGTTNQFEFITRNKLTIVPDFGLIVVARGGSSFAATNILPYLGFNINFRQINKDIPFSTIRNKTVAHRLSFMAGITLSSLAIQGEREDLFSGKSLMTGLGIRFNNVVKLALGGVWFKALSTKPLSVEKKLMFSPYVGLSLDLELKDLFGGIAKLFN
ncbi:hypothetical protein GCM10028825_07620 [Spirosoma agri]